MQKAFFLYSHEVILIIMKDILRGYSLRLSVTYLKRFLLYLENMARRFISSLREIKLQQLITK